MLFFGMETKGYSLNNKANRRGGIRNAIFFTVVFLFFSVGCNIWGHQPESLISSSSFDVEDLFIPSIRSSEHKSNSPPFSNRLIIAGTQKGGTTALWVYLKDHPYIQRSNPYSKERAKFTLGAELHFFDSRMYSAPGLSFGQFPNGTIHPEDRENVLDAYNSHWNASSSNSTIGESDKNIIMMEKVPSYMLKSKVPYRIKSVVPDAKIIFLLRNPGQRAYSHYKMMTSKNRRSKYTKNLSFEDCVALDIAALRKMGVIEGTNHDGVKPVASVKGDASSRQKSFDWEKRDMAWARYLKVPKIKVCDNIIGRGIYAMQLRIWWKVYNQRERRDKFLILKSESLLPTEKKSGDGMLVVNLKKITDFLGIAALNVDSDVTNTTSAATTTNNHLLAKGINSTMNRSTEIMLQEFYAPFNNDLDDMLGDELWSDSWL